MIEEQILQIIVNSISSINIERCGVYINFTNGQSRYIPIGCNDIPDCFYLFTDDTKSYSVRDLLISTAELKASLEEDILLGQRATILTMQDKIKQLEDKLSALEKKNE